MKRIRTYAYIFSTVLLVLLLFFIFIKTRKIDNKYNLETNYQSSLTSSIALYFIKPIVEIYLDSRLQDSRFLDSVKLKNFPDKIISKTIIKQGEGKNIICGQKIKINVSGPDIKKREDFEYSVGNSTIEALNIAPIGMKKGESAKISVPGFLIDDFFGESYDKKSESFIDVEILDVLDNYPEEIENAKIFTEKITNEKAKMCGETVKILYKVSDIEGKILESGEANFKIGKRELPIIFDVFSIGLQPGVKNLVIANGNLMGPGYNSEIKFLELSVIN